MRTALSSHEADVLARLAAGGLALELGAQYGASTVALARWAAMVHSVDWHGGDPQAGWGDSLPEFWENVKRAGVREKVVVHVGPFSAVLPLLKDKSFDVVFVDGMHDAISVATDAAEAFRLVKDGGVVAFHDYARATTPGVREGLRQWGEAHEVYDTIGVCRR